MSTAPIAAVDSGNSPGQHHRWLALAVVLTATFMDLVDATVVNVAVPNIQRNLNTSFSAIQWITGGYALAFAIGLITGGRLGDIYGRKKIFLFGVAGFTVASTLSGLAVDSSMLIAARILQGLGAALMIPQVLAIMHVTFSFKERGKVFGMFGAMIGIGAVSGPLLGALLTEWDIFGLQWRPIFLINLPIGIAGLMLGKIYISESKSPRALQLDLGGLVFVTLGLLMLLYPLTQGRDLKWSPWGFVSITAGLGVFILFIYYERFKIRKNGSPLVELSLFRIKSFTAGMGIQLTFSVISSIFFLVWMLYLQIGLGWTPLHAGLSSLPFAIAVSAAAAISVQKLVPRFGRKVLQAGALMMVAGGLVFLWAVEQFGNTVEIGQLTPALLIMGAGMGLIVAPLTNVALSDVPKEHSGSASGLINTTNQLGLALGFALLSVVFFGGADENSITGSVSFTFIENFSHALWWLIGLLFIVFLLMFALPKQNRQQEGAVSGQLF